MITCYTWIRCPLWRMLGDGYVGTLTTIFATFCESIIRSKLKLTTTTAAKVSHTKIVNCGQSQVHSQTQRESSPWQMGPLAFTQQSSAYPSEMLSVCSPSAPAFSFRACPTINISITLSLSASRKSKPPNPHTSTHTHTLILKAVLFLHWT